MKTKDMALIALMAVMICLCSWINIALLSIVPFTMQTFAVYCSLLLLGGKRGTLAVLLYVFMGAVGLPVFSGFNAGIGALLGPTGGYILGFILCALLYWLLEKRLNHIVLLVLGTALCYAFGTVWFVNVYSAGGNPISITGALMSCVVPFILPDAAKLALAVAICHRIPTTFPVSDK
jgi:biotin transport system substrate-specific component